MLPTDALIKFVVCDSAREEKDNKVSLLGIYPDGILRLPSDARFPAALTLTLVYFLLDGEGKFDGSIVVRPHLPHLQPPFKAEMKNIVKVANQPATVMVGFAPFIAFAFGKHDAILTLNSQSYPRVFEIAPVQTVGELTNQHYRNH
jgi:hypothetical protein